MFVWGKRRTRSACTNERTTETTNKTAFRYHPFVQARGRVDQLRRLGHSVDKVEFILMGGTFMSLPSDYRDFFVRNLHDALSGHTSASVAEAVRPFLVKCNFIFVLARIPHGAHGGHTSVTVAAQQHTGALAFPLRWVRSCCAVAFWCANAREHGAELRRRSARKSRSRCNALPPAGVCPRPCPWLFTLPQLKFGKL